MVGSILCWLAYCAAVIGVIWVGWNEPIKYRFMSREDIDLLEHPPGPPPAPVTPWMWDPNRKTGLDSQPTNIYQPQSTGLNTPYPSGLR